MSVVSDAAVVVDAAAVESTVELVAVVVPLEEGQVTVEVVC